ncbi:unnamed protein product, partial [Mesorhabditis belari]|uniref:Protein kinase domain-containing protein n=1 Tax=Mesorhabditis belari TaxID=2138241 RepID=A0AAF3J409_9BILA
MPKDSEDEPIFARGTFGSVRLKKGNPTIVIKAVNYNTNSEQDKRLRRELDFMMKRNKHPNIVTFYEYRFVKEKMIYEETITFNVAPFFKANDNVRMRPIGFDGTKNPVPVKDFDGSEFPTNELFLDAIDINAPIEKKLDDYQEKSKKEFDRESMLFTKDVFFADDAVKKQILRIQEIGIAVGQAYRHSLDKIVPDPKHLKKVDRMSVTIRAKKKFVVSLNFFAKVPGSRAQFLDEIFYELLTPNPFLSTLLKQSFSEKMLIDVLTSFYHLHLVPFHESSYSLRRLYFKAFECLIEANQTPFDQLSEMKNRILDVISLLKREKNKKANQEIIPLACYRDESQIWILLSKNEKHFMKTNFLEHRYLDGEFAKTFTEFHLNLGEKKVKVLKLSRLYGFNMSSLLQILTNKLNEIEEDLVNREKVSSSHKWLEMPMYEPHINYIFDFNSSPADPQATMFSELDQESLEELIDAHSFYCRSSPYKLKFMSSLYRIFGKSDRQEKVEHFLFRRLKKTGNQSHQLLLLEKVTSVSKRVVYCLNFDQSHFEKRWVALDSVDSVVVKHSLIDFHQAFMEAKSKNVVDLTTKI